MAFFRTRDGCSLYYETIGSERAKPAVIFLNGTLQTTMYWKVIAAALKPQLRTLLYDARGQGASELGDRPLSLDLHMADLTDLMHYLGLRSACMVGLSHGGLLAYAMARRSPQRVNRLLICSIGARRTVRSRLIVRSWSRIIAAAGLAGLVDAAIPHVFGERYLSDNVKILDRISKTIVRRNRESAVAAHLEAMVRYPAVHSLLGPLEMPLLVMVGADDPLVGVPSAVEVAERSGGRHLVIHAVGHSVPVEAPQLFLKTTARFLAGRWTDMPEGL
jgi:pimeloyl-ACP methyl ester carboxylesterase